jgi:enamine deaminase RidA (YjgF/YER057c/UK114 family)
MSVEAILSEWNLELPPAPKPVGVYRPILISGSLAYVSGHGPLLPDGSLITGRVGQDLDRQAGYQAARQVGLAVLATLRANLGSLDRVQRLVKTLGFVNCTPEFTEHPAVINGFSELFAELYGAERGIGARSALGALVLPGNMAVEIEAVFEIAEQ